jgi:transposase-like protein
MAIEEAFIMQRARQLYWQGYPPAEIARLMGINQNTVYSWKKRDEWDATPPIQRVTTSIDARLIQLTGKDKKTGGDFKEIDLLTRQLKKLDNGTAATQPKKRSAKSKTISQSRRLPRCGRTFSALCTGTRKGGMTITTGATA